MARRFQFSILALLALGFSAAQAQQPEPRQPAAPPAPRSIVYFGSERGLMNGFEANGEPVRVLTDELVMAVTGQKSVAAAWSSLVKPTDHIGIKISTAGGPEFSTHRPIVQAVVRGLEEAGVPMSQVVIWDRGNPAAAGYREEPGGPGLRAIEPVIGYDPRAVIESPLAGKLIWGDLAFAPRGFDPLAPRERDQISVESHWSRLICGLNKIINLPVMAASEDCGLAGCLYNVTIPNVDNWRRFVTEPAYGDPCLATLYSDPHAGPKVVLNLMDGLIAQYGGGPEWQPNYCWTHATLYASRDPVAIDATAVRLLEKWRSQAKLPALGARAHYLETAETMDLGRANADEIELRLVGASGRLSEQAPVIGTSR